MNYSALVKGAALFSLVLFMLIGGFVVINTSFKDAPERAFNVSNESITVDQLDTTAVDAASEDTTEGFNGTVQVWYNGTKLDQGIDYDWNASSGAVYWTNSPNTDDGGNASITYAYTRNAVSVDQMEALAQDIAPLLPYLALLVAGMGLVVGLFGIRSLTNRGGVSR